MCSTDFDSAEVFSQTLVKRSRLERRCYECNLPIPVGAPYIKTFMVYDGNPDTFSVHAGCDAIVEFVRDDICRVEHENEQAGLPKHIPRERFDGTILMGGLDEEISQLAEYQWSLTAEDAADARALGFEVDEDDGQLTASPAQVAEWAWEVAREQYRPGPPERSPAK